MRIALSCNGEGFGHVARLVSFAEELSALHELYFFAPVSVQGFIKKKIPNAIIVTIPHFELVKDRDRVCYIRTILLNRRCLIDFFMALRMIKKMLCRLKIEACISDYEPIIPWAARINGIAVMQVNHPAIVMRYWSMNPCLWVARLISLLMMGPYNKKLICSFYKGDVGPILRREILNAKVQTDELIVVYLKNEYRNAVIDTFEQIGLNNYVVFPDISKDYVDYLRRAKAVISSAGHQSMSECLYLNKPLLVIPQVGQYEQKLNAKMLKESGRGEYCSLKNLKTLLPIFLNNLHHYPKKQNSMIEFCFDADNEKLNTSLHQFLLEAKSKSFSSSLICAEEH